jgi:hypothetical protein
MKFQKWMIIRKRSQLRENEMKDLIFLLVIVLIISLLFLLSGCTYSVTLAHTEGQATDLIDQEQTAQPDVKADLTIPAI